ncbi:MAG: DNA methyltransferase [Hyphomonadaceae bacterium]
MSDPKIEQVAIGDLKPYSNNPRSRPRAQRCAIAASIKKNGFNAPIVVDEANVIINGHGRYEAALTLELTSVPVIRVTHLSAAEKQAYRIADNKLSEMSSWNADLLPEELRAIADGGIKFEDTGFSATDVDRIFDQAAEARGPDLGPEDELPAHPSVAVTKPGQTWVLGQHRIGCADMRDSTALERLMDGQRARATFTDPPYNVRIGGFAGGKGQTKHPEFAMASGEMSAAQYTEFLSIALKNIAKYCLDGAIAFVCIDWRHLDEMSAAGRSAQLTLMNLIVWVKSNGGMGTFYRSRHELIFAFKVGEAPHTNTFGLGDGGRCRTNVWEYRGANAFGPTRDEDLASHPTVKPARMVADAIKDVSQRGDIILDPFGGSGTTLIACQMTGRIACVLEIEPSYVDLTIRRWQKAMGLFAVDADTGVEFDELASAIGGVP